MPFGEQFWHAFTSWHFFLQVSLFFWGCLILPQEFGHVNKMYFSRTGVRKNVKELMNNISVCVQALWACIMQYWFKLTFLILLLQWDLYRKYLWRCVASNLYTYYIKPLPKIIINCRQYKSWIFTNSAPMGRVGLGVAMSVCLWVCLCVCLFAPSSAVFF